MYFIYDNFFSKTCEIEVNDRSSPINNFRLRPTVVVVELPRSIINVNLRDIVRCGAALIHRHTMHIANQIILVTRGRQNDHKT